MCLKNKKGSVLITLIAAMVLMAVLGVGIYTITTSSSLSELLSNRNDNAYQLAKSGVRYAVDICNANPNCLPSSVEYLMPDSGKKFTLAKNGDDITSTGIVNEGSFLEARRVLKYTFVSGGGGGDPVISDLPINAAISANPSSSIINNGTTITLGGNNVAQSYGAIWYNGNKTNGNCNAGSCSFGFGLRAYFEFTVPSGTGDGFTFALISALTNITNDRTGGFSKTEYPGSYRRSDGTYTSVAGGELMGYAGPGNTRGKAVGPGEGLMPPKMALELDTYQGDAYTPLYLAGTRNDPSGGHVALVFWGDSTVTGNTPALTYSGGGTHTYPLSSFDDNRHGTGQSGRVNGLGSTNYSVEDGQPRSCRIEIIRATSPESSGTHAGKYRYTINTWIEQRSVLSTIHQSRLQDVIVPFTDASLTPRISQSAYLTAQEHSDFEKIYWGFTQGTGDAVQQVPITNVAVFFPNTGTNCSYTLSPATASYPSAGGTGSVNLTTTNDCYWRVSSLDNWITITYTPNGQGGQGSGTINYTVSQNMGSNRNGVINIAGQSFSINQTAQAPTVTSITPATGNNNNQRFTVDITGTGFQSGATVTQSGAAGGNFTIDQVTVVSATQISARFRISSQVPTGARTIRVTNPDSLYDEVGFTVY